MVIFHMLRAYSEFKLWQEATRVHTNNEDSNPKTFSFKVRTFWETQKIWKNLLHGFDKSAVLLSQRQNQKEDLFKLCVHLKKSELYQ